MQPTLLLTHFQGLSSFLDMQCLIYLCHITGSIVAALSGDLLTGHFFSLYTKQKCSFYLIRHHCKRAVGG